jgi:hypothetical protein
MVIEVTDTDTDSVVMTSDAKDAEIENWCAWLDRYLAIVRVSAM